MFASQNIKFERLLGGGPDNRLAATIAAEIGLPVVRPALCGIRGEGGTAPRSSSSLGVQTDGELGVIITVFNKPARATNNIKQEKKSKSDDDRRQ